MNYLLIDTSSSHVLVSIIKDYKIIGLFNEEIKDDMSSQILIILDNCLKQANVSLEDINKLFIINGPGSFTGVRVGVTLAKVISWSLNIGLIPLSSLELLASSSSNNLIIPLINARRGNVFAGAYDNKLNNVLSNGLYNLNELVEKYKEAEYISYDSFDVIGVSRPNVDIIKVIKKHENDSTVNAHKLVPNYLKRTEAEEKLYDKGI